MTIKNLDFDKNYRYEKIETIVEKKPLFCFSKLELFTNSTFKTSVKKEEKLSAALSILSVTFLKAKSNDDYFSSAP